MSEGAPPRPTPAWQRSRALFVRGLGLTWLCAFVSLGLQLEGLVGSHGILPVAEWVRALREGADAGPLWPAPSLLLLDASDATLAALWIAGAVAGALALAGLVPAAALALAWVLYLSLANGGQIFLGYQWDRLILETGFLGIFAAPWRLRLGGASSPRASRVVRVLLWWLLFRLMFFSGFVKLASGDPTWRDLTALSYHWWTQPLPAWTSWWVAQGPTLLDRAGTAATLGIELGLPWLVFLGRRPRLVAGAGFALLQASIAATGNYGFFNLLSVVLCLPLVDDSDWQRLRRRPSPAAPPPPPRSTVARAATAVATALVVVTSIPFAGVQAGLVRSVPSPLAELCEGAGRFGVVGSYGLFAVMTTDRPEIVVEGSRDGATWEPYVFRWKPGPLDRAPAFTGPHMPRLDWQMWFAALRPERPEAWFYAFLRHLLRGTPEVRALLAHDPFPDAPPLAVRARLYRYRFTDRAERSRTGSWWQRSLVGDYVPPARLASEGGEIRP